MLCEAKKWVYDCFIVVVELSFGFNGIFLEKCGVLIILDWKKWSGADFFLKMVGELIQTKDGGGHLFFETTPLFDIITLM